MDRLLIAIFLLLPAILGGCRSAPAAPGLEGVLPLPTVVDARLLPLLDTTPSPQVLLLGEQHDAPQHQMLEQAVVESLIRHGRLSTLALEMAEQGRSTVGLTAQADEAQVQQALAWNDAGWPWAAYGPVIMAAVREQIPVVGANLPRSQQRIAMKNEAIDALLTRDAIEKQQEMILQGHCGLLAREQVQPMTRIQIARDQAMARSLEQAVAQTPPAQLEQRHLRRPVVVLISGNGHIDRRLGVPQHLPPHRVARVVRMLSAGEGTEDASGDAPRTGLPPFDATWPTRPREPRDYCAEFRNSMQPKAQP